MNVFVGGFMTIEYGLKAIIAAPIRWLIGGDEPQDILCLVSDPDNEMRVISPTSQMVMQFENQGLTLMQIPRYAKLREMFFKLKDLMINGYKEFKANPLVKRIKYADVSSILDGGNNEGDKLLLRFHNKKIVKYVSFQVFDKETGYKTSSKAIFSKFIGQLFGSNEVIDID